MGPPAGGGSAGEGLMARAGRGGARLGPEPALEIFTGEGRLLLSAFARDG